MNKFKFFISMLIVILLGACSQTNEDKARSLIEARLQASMSEEEWESYRYLDMSKMDSTYTSFYSTEAGKCHKARKDSINALVHAYEIALAKADTLGDMRQIARLRDSLSIQEHEQLRIIGRALTAEQNYEGDFNGFRTHFRYMVNNRFGVQVLETRWFFFNEDVTEITQVLK